MKVQIILNNLEKINLELYPEIAPKTVANFISLVKQGYYKNTVFHRIIADFMIQTGGYEIENNTLKELEEVPSIYGEFASNGFENNIKHQLGVISMARASDPNSATSQFFLCVADDPWLDGEYAAFGRTTDQESNNVILNISHLPTCNIGGGFTDFPRYDISILEIKVIEE